MGNKQSVFQIILLVVFGLFALAGAIAIATHESDSGTVVADIPIVIWGPDSEIMAMKKILRGLEKKKEILKKLV